MLNRAFRPIGSDPVVPTDASGAAFRRTDTHSWRHVIIVLIAIVGTSASIGMFVAIRQWQAHVADLRFTSLARDDLQAINAGLQDATDLLYTLRAYFESADHRVTRAEFQAFSGRLRELAVGLRDTGWAPRVTAAERGAFEHEVRASGFPDFQIIERNADGKFVPAQQRAEYFPILYSDPGELNRPILGFDLASENLRRRAVVHARDTDQPAATPPLKLVNVQRPNGGVMSFIPVHGGQDATGDMPRPVAGVLLGAFETEAMIKNILTSKALLKSVDLYVFDPAGSVGQRLIYWHSANGRPVPPEAALLANWHWQGRLQLVDQQWGAIFGPSDAFDAGTAAWTAPAVLVGGLIVVASIIGYLWFSLRHTKALESAALLARVSEERFRTLITATTQIVWLTNATGESIEDSPSWRDFTGQGYEATRGHGWADAIHPDDVMRAREQWDRAIASKTTLKTEYRIRGRDGNYREFQSYGVPLLNSDQTIREWVGTCTDVTDRNRLDEALRKSEERLTLATESARIGIWDWDVVANKLVWDARMYELYGIREQDFSGAYDAWKAGLHPDDLARGDAAITAAIDRVNDFNVEFRVMWPNGEVHNIEAHALVQGPPNGRATRMIGVNWDITERKHAAETISRQADQYMTMLATTADGFYLIDRNGRFLTVNDAYCSITGYSREELLTLGIGEVEVIESSDATERHIEAIRNAGFDRFETQHRRKDGSIVDIEGSVSFWRSTGEFLCFARDITARKRAEEKLRASEEKYRELFESTHDAIMLLDPSSGQFIAANSSAVGLFGVKDEAELVSYKPWDVSPEAQPDGRLSAEKAREMIESTRSNGTHSFEWMHRRTDGTEFVADVLLTLVSHGKDEVVYATVRDITERKRVEDQVTHMARRDNLTGLANRHVFVEALEQAIARVRRGLSSFAVLYLDLDHFKDVNDTLGHPVGDLLLQSVAERLRASVREVDTVARFGGDEFAILLNDIGEPANAAAVSRGDPDAAIGRAAVEEEMAVIAAGVAEKIIRSLSEPIATQTNLVHTGASVGIAVSGSDASDAEILLSHADVALYRAKTEQRGTYRFFTDGMDAEVRGRVRICAELREAISMGQFFLVYQPQVDIDTGGIVGLEALVRWRHPIRGVVGAGHFIPEAERNGLIVPLGRWVMDEACRQVRQWLDAGIAPPLVGVNLSGVQFKRPLDLERDILAATADAGVPPQCLELELTESVLMEASRAHNDLLIRFRGRGHRLAIDDFGSGYSSLDYLRRYPVDRIKIAQNFIADIGIEPGNDAIVKAALGLARELGIEVVVEGVETIAQRNLLKTWGCKTVQGYYFARPLAVADATARLRVGKIEPAASGLLELAAN